LKKETFGNERAGRKVYFYHEIKQEFLKCVPIRNYISGSLYRSARRANIYFATNAVISAEISLV
jgi:hypothetical protein